MLLEPTRSRWATVLSYATYVGESIKQQTTPSRKLSVMRVKRKVTLQRYAAASQKEHDLYHSNQRRHIK